MEKQNTLINENGISNKKILIVGDWVVDDNWVVVDHRSPKSSRTGLMHHRALHGNNASIRAFCGAGQTASILRETRKNGVLVHHILGLGVWARNDDRGIKGLFDIENTKENNPHCIFKNINDEKIVNVDLFNLADYIGSDEHIEVGTTRVIRTYLKIGDKINQLQRIDWELPAPRTTNEGLPE